MACNKRKHPSIAASFAARCSSRQLGRRKRGNVKQDEIVRIVEQGGQFLEEALNKYWPTNGNNEIAERNVTLALARAFAADDFYLYAEAHRKKDTKLRLDLLALNFQSSVQVAIEAKRLYNSDGAEGMLEDVNRILNFELAKAGGVANPLSHKYGVVIALTRNKNYVDWFCNETAKDPKGKIWRKFWKKKALKNASWGAIHLQTWQEAGKEFQQNLVYCVFRVP